MIQSKEWFAVYTKPRWEKKVFSVLEAQGITAYCPLNRVVKQWSDRKKMVSVPLFSSYVFVQISLDEQMKVRMTPGIVNFVYWLGRIAPIRDEEMVSLQQFVANHGNIRVEKASYSKGDFFEIATGPLRGREAIVEEVWNNKLELTLKSMNVRLVVDYPTAHNQQPTA